MKEFLDKLKRAKKRFIKSSVAMALLIIMLLGATYAYFKSVDTSNTNFDTQVTDMNFMFNACSSLISLDMRNATFGNVTSYGGMFQNNPSTITVHVKDEDVKTFIEARLGSGNGTVVIA